MKEKISKLKLFSLLVDEYTYSESKKEGWFTDTGVTDKKYLEQIVAID